MNEIKLLNKINSIPNQEIRNFVISKYHVGIANKTIATTKSKLTDNTNHFFKHIADIINDKLFQAINLVNLSNEYKSDVEAKFLTQNSFRINKDIFYKDFIEYFDIKED